MPWDPTMPPVLSPADLRFFEQHGFVVARGAVSRDQAARTAAEAWRVSGSDPQDPSTWYEGDVRRDEGGTGWLRALEAGRVAMVEPWHNRTAPRVHCAFSQLWRSERLWCSHDVVGIRPPERCRRAERARDWEASAATALHWDRGELYDYRPPVAGGGRPLRSVRDAVGALSFSLQGMLLLTDTPQENGALCLVPGFHRRLGSWLESLPSESTPMEQLARMARRRECSLQRVGGEAGDLVIWSSDLPHGSTINTGDAPRLVQYIVLVPAAGDQSELSTELVRGTVRSDRIRLWEQHVGGASGCPAVLAGAAARRIVGVEAWSGGEREGFAGSAAEWRAVGCAARI
jgi:ectoine hydroxylase-related dioxygenase (phytanoyl-CoA dioxygenase family)